MSFSKCQRSEFFPLRDAAWREHASKNRLEPKDPAAKDHWYREIMRDELGVFSSKQLSPLNDYCAAMAIMESIAGGSFERGKPQPGRRYGERLFVPGRMHWNLRATQTESSRRLLYAVKEICREHALEEHYVREVARRISGRGETPLLQQLNAEHLRKLLAALRIHVKRHLAPEEDEAALGTPSPSSANADPF